MQPEADYFFIATIIHVEANVRNNTEINEEGSGLINDDAVRNDEGRRGEERNATTKARKTRRKKPCGRWDF